MRHATVVSALLVSALSVACGGDGTGSASGASSGGSGNGSGGDANAGGGGSGNGPGGCGISTGYAGDDRCLAPPAPGEGIQIHVGPTDYTDSAEVAQFLMQPGDESSECWTFHTPNMEKVYYQSFELSGRPGTHHIINTMYKTELEDGGFSACKDPGVGLSGDILANLPGASRPVILREPVAPENEHIASEIPANTPSQADMHYFNLTDQPILREFWLNIYTVPESQVTEASNQIRGMGGLSWNFTPIPPQSHDTYQYTCPIPADGRVIELIGHTHAHGIRETAWIRHAGGDRTKVFEQFNYLEPQIFYYDTVTQNPAFSEREAGALTGQLPVVAGDSLDWECEVNNDSDVALRYTNEVKTGEMCNIWGQSVGPLINCVLQ
ncbi:MAG TPA: hypothetical protein VHE30_30105 [Polyangiaceae bacterium]|nr:hypothetical protein [Polyangiaceae bacterium]